MKASKLTLIAALALGSMLTLGTALAQNTNAPSKPAVGERPGGRMRPMDRLAQNLNLTDEQKPKVEAIFKERMTKGREIFQDQSLSQEDRRAKIQALREEVNKKMKAVLTDEQYAKWEKAPMNRMGGPRGPRGPHHGGTNNPAGGPPSDN